MKHNHHLRIQDPRNLDAVIELVADQTFCVSAVDHCPQTRTVRIPFLFDGHDQPTIVKNWWILQKLRQPLRKACLSFHGTNRCQILDRSHIEEYGFSYIHYHSVGSRIIVEAIQDLEVILDVDRCDIEVTISHEYGRDMIRYVVLGGLVEIG